MSVIGLTGCFSCGKSSVLRMLKNKGAYVFDCDEFIHACYKNKESPVYRKVAKEFPDVLERGRINRRKLGRLAFSDRRKLKALEAIVHPQAIKGLLSWVKKARKNKVLCVGEVPLLFEKKLDRYFDKIILVAVKRSVQIKRIREKYNFSRAEILNRLSAFANTAAKKKKSDFFINNNSDLKKLQKEVDLLWKKLNQK